MTPPPPFLSPLSIPSGRIVGQGLTDHMDVRKLGFTGSTGVGKTIMKRYMCGHIPGSRVQMFVSPHVSSFIHDF